MEEEIALCKGWLAVSENSKQGNSRKSSGFWCEVLSYIESKTGKPSLNFDMCWVTEVLKGHPKWQEIAIPTFNTGFEVSSKRHKSTGSSSFKIESGEASINLNSNVGDNDKDDVQEIRRREGRDKAKAAGKKKGSKSSASSSVNEDALARLMVTEMGAQEKEERLAFLDIKMREVECREQEIEQQDMRFYLQPYDHLVGDQRKAMDEIRAKIKANGDLQ
ncbi:gamma-glutamyltranspeptidase 1 [Tanacetum coccineum]